MAISKDIFFSDFDWTFTPHPKTGDISILKNDQAIKRSLKNLILTKLSERRFYSDKGSSVLQFLFEPLDVISARAIKDAVRNVVNNYEPRIEIADVAVLSDMDETGIFVTISYKILNSITIDTTTIFLERAR